MRHRDHRTYAEVLSNKGDMGHKVAFTNALLEDLVGFVISQLDLEVKFVILTFDLRGNCCHLPSSVNFITLLLGRYLLIFYHHTSSCHVLP